MSNMITSLHNPQVKQVARLEKRSERERERLFPVEGTREVSRALAAGQIPHTFARNLQMGRSRSLFCANWSSCMAAGAHGSTP